MIQFQSLRKRQHLQSRTWVIHRYLTNNVLLFLKCKRQITSKFFWFLCLGYVDEGDPTHKCEHCGAIM